MCSKVYDLLNVRAPYSSLALKLTVNTVVEANTTTKNITKPIFSSEQIYLHSSEV